jgi:hypothetical protein
VDANSNINLAAWRREFELVFRPYIRYPRSLLPTVAG